MRVRAPRVPMDLEVESRTIGTSAAYRFSTIDISRSGLLLAWERESRMPFIVNTLLELTIDPKGAHLDKPVSCLGKVVRREGPEAEEGAEKNGNHARIGIQIVQIDNSDLQQWEGCLVQLERQFGIELSNKIVPA
jgi:hypothetical protein